MKLKLLRQHYTQKTGNRWTPKRSFSSKEEIIATLGDIPATDYIYICDFCQKFHTATHSYAKV